MTLQHPVLVLVDDDPLVRQMVDRFGADAGYDVVSSAGGAQLLDQLQRQPALVLVDLQMPGVQGLRVLRAVRERVPSCQIVLTSCETTIKQAVEALQLGALDYLSKPLDFERLGRLLVAVRDESARRRSLLAISTAAERTLFNTHWEGHLRELRNRAEPDSLLAEGLLTPEWGRVGAATTPELATTPALATGAVPVIAREPQEQDRNELGLRRVERDHIVRVLERSRGNKKAAAELLGISRRKLYRYLEEYHLHIPHKTQQHTDSALL